MARKPRAEFAGGYHVIARGNQRQKIFRDARDRPYCIQRIDHYRRRHEFEIYAYVLRGRREI